MTVPHISQETRVLYNGSCPICDFEIGHYRKIAARYGAPVAFDDLSGPALDNWGLSPDAAARRLHVRQGDRTVTGLAAFQAIWQQLPGWRWLAWVTGLPGLRQGLTWAYDHLGAPLLYRAHRRRMERRNMR